MKLLLIKIIEVIKKNKSLYTVLSFLKSFHLISTKNLIIIILSVYIINIEILDKNKNKEINIWKKQALIPLLDGLGRKMYYKNKNNDKTFYEKKCVGSVVIYKDKSIKNINKEDIKNINLGLYSFFYQKKNIDELDYNKIPYVNAVYTEPILHQYKIYNDLYIYDWIENGYSIINYNNGLTCISSKIQFKLLKNLNNIDCINKNSVIVFCYSENIGMFIINGDDFIDVNAMRQNILDTFGYD